jgi:sugar/nucleoside kinase (ribokinase family)
MSLIVTGSIGIDSVEAPTGQAENVLGGSAIYFAAAASFFSRVRLVGAVGEDFPDHFLDTFRHFNIDLAGLERRAGSKTFRWRGKYHANMNQRDTLSVELNVLAEDLPPVPPHFCDSQYVFLANTDPGNQMKLLAQFPRRKLAVADTMDLWIHTQRDALITLLGQVDGLVLNDSEAIALTGHSNLIRAGDSVLAMGPRFVVIKKGEHGAVFMHQDEGICMLPAYAARHVVDPTGAGDSFAGGMMGYLASNGGLDGEGFRRALAYGTMVASFNIESFGLERLKQITRADLDKRLNEYARMVRV